MSSKTSFKTTSSSSAAVSNGKPNAWSRPLQQPPKSATTAPPPGMGAPPILRERFLHLTLSMVGQRVSVTKTNGETIEGIFYTFTPFESSKIKYVLKASHGDGVETGSTLILDATEVAHVYVKSLRLDTSTSKSSTNGDATFQTDVQISGSKHDKNRDLVAAGSAWTTASGGGGNLRAEGLRGDGPSGKQQQQQVGHLKGNIGEWDQFKANEELFNVQATFDENLYTTALDHSKLDGRQRMEAARIAKEIEGTASSNIHIAEERGQKLEGDYDEEDLYSGVLKPSLQPRNVDQKSKQAQKPEAATPSEKGKSGPKKMNYAAAAAKADVKAAVPPGFVKPAVVTPGDEKKEEEANGEAGPAPVTPTGADNAEATKEGKEKATESKDEEKPTEKEGEKKKPATKLNANAKEFSFNPSAKTFTPTFGGGAPPAGMPPVESYPPIDPNTGMPMGPGGPQMPPQYMQHPGMGQPGMVPMMNAHFAMRYQPGPYPGMEHQMAMQVPPQHQPQHFQQHAPVAPEMQQPPSAPGSQQASAPGSVEGGDSPAPPTSGDDASATASEGASAGPPPPQQQQHQPMPQQSHMPQQPNQPMQQMPYGGGPPQNYYPGMMPPPPGGRYPPPPQMGPPGANPYGHPAMYGTPMPMNPNMMRGPAGGSYYPPMGGMHYPPGAYGSGMMDDDQGYRGRGGRAGRGQRRGGGGRKGGRGGRGYSNYSGGGGSGRQTPQSTVSDSVSDVGVESKASTPPTEEAPKPSGEE